jgi:hypothetical protein
MTATPNACRQVDKADNFNSGVEKRDASREPKRTNRVCAREVCNNRVPKVNRMLCLHCYQKGDYLAESDLCFAERDNAHWQQKKNELINRIEGKVRIYSNQNMTQKELRALVPSLKGEAA